MSRGRKATTQLIGVTVTSGLPQSDASGHRHDRCDRDVHDAYGGKQRQLCLSLMKFRLGVTALSQAQRNGRRQDENRAAGFEEL